MKLTTKRKICLITLIFVISFGMYYVQIPILESSTPWSIAIVSHYILPKNEYRMIVIGSCNDTSKFYLKINTLDGAILHLSLKQTSFIDGCIRTFVGCPWSGFFLSTKLPNNVDLTQPFSLMKHLPNVNHIASSTMDVPHVISDGKKEHFLSMCIQPLYLYADWLMIIQFLEIWLQLGVSKYYMYVQSVTPEVMQIINMYVSDGIVEIVEWPLMPSSNNVNLNGNPNEQVHRTGITAAINDCLLRARSTTTFVVFVDLDEFIIPANSMNFSSWLTIEERKLRPDDNRIGIYEFKKSNCEFDVPPMFLGSSNDLNKVRMNDIDLSYLANNGRCTCSPGSPEKLVLKPEAVHRLDIHKVTEKNLNYRMVSIPMDQVMIYHLRRVETLIYNCEKLAVMPTISLKSFPINATDELKKRLKKNGVIDKFLINRAVSVNEDVEECRNQKLNIQKRCPTPINCEDMIRAVKHDEWILPGRKWNVI